MGIIKNITFLKAFLAKSSLPPIYGSISDNKGFDYKAETSKTLHTNKQVFLIKDIPDYLHVDIKETENKTSLSKIKTLKGHLIDFQLFKGFPDYLEQNFSAKSRSNLRRYQNRLETCFNINYICYYGAIPKPEYDNLFVVLKHLLLRRFNEKQEVNYELQHLNEFHDIVYDLVLNKKASIYVIYDGQKPISIRINMHKERLSFYIISGYDIDYSKFHLGAIDMLKSIEWCFNNDFEVYDLLKGYDYYKVKWATTCYHYYNHIVYNSSSIKASFIGKLAYIKEVIKYKCYTATKNSKLYFAYKKINKKIFGITRSDNKKSTFIISNPTKNDIRNIALIDIEKNNDYAFLRKALYDFLFISKESTNNVSVYKFNNSQNTFLIKSKNQSQLVTID
ncbi:GNAT family N-acetyltransferase [Flavivirga abyssicola]|uniref:GNAT family N-acetyltransferase n=1 Tax=Flavivirga abyssicola TaxID=3063533 RepID=UPI0026E030FA|nr:GNAT family N-acetyltransferase [Flavivirga sp. MEBiC07777]WVK13000.1 GNAT family N-acetyltransferase [Flavivirga sp. MEBiC07777]